MAPIPKSLGERFWPKVRVGADEECWEFVGGRTSAGYGVIMREDQTLALAHRTAYLLVTGEDLPSNIFLLHSCDNPPCCNPRHLRPGTHKDNMEDMSGKGRARGGRKPATHCGRGHILEGSNLYYQKPDKRRRCRLCRNMKARERVALKKQTLERRLR